MKRLRRVPAHYFSLAETLAGLWRVVNQPGISDTERVQHLLDFSTRSLRPDQPFVGLLTHLEEGTVFVDAVSLHGPPSQGLSVAAKVLAPGAAFPFDATIHRRLFAGGKAQYWDDLTHPGEDVPASGVLAWGSLIGTTFQLGAKTTFLLFGSPQTTGERPFTSDDSAFIDVLASIVGHRLQQELLRERLRYQIEHDLLTGLPNRVQFRLALQSAVTASRSCAIALVDLGDLDVVKKVNGQMVADELLVEVGTELDAVSEFDVVARVDGDRFAVLMHDIENESSATLQTRAYLTRFRRPFKTGDRDGTRLISIGASFGLALFPADGTDAEGLMRRAMFAVEVAQDHGAGALAFFRQEMEDEFRRHRVARVELLHAIETDQLRLDYQPTFDLMTGELAGAEALVRWEHPTMGLLAPSEFVPFAEREEELIDALGHWVIKRTISDLATLENVPSRFCCYLNVAPLQLRSTEFLKDLKVELAAFPQVARRLGIEITESGAMQSVEHSITILNELRDLGLRIALDDFGTGYSSLSHLKRLPLNLVKIDQSFVKGLPYDRHDVALCETMISIADRFGFSTLAEGIENPEQAAWLREHGCRFGQGFDLARPAAWGELRARLGKALVARQP